MERAFAALERFVEAARGPRNLPGVSIGVTDRHRLLGVFAYGFADLASSALVRPETLFQIGSISKSFTAMALMRELERGRLRLDAPVTEYLPWFEVRTGFEPITLHHLLCHTAGLIQGAESTTEGRSEVWKLRETETGAPPGTFFHYSNVGYKMLGLTLEAVTGETYAEAIGSRVLRPLEMTSTEPAIAHEMRWRTATGYEPYYDDRPLPPGGRLAPATWIESATADGSIASTAEDMATYLRCLLNRGRGVVSEESFALMTRPLIGDTDDPEKEWYYGYGIGVRTIDGHACLSHGGGMVGYACHLLADLDEGVGVIVLTNGSGDNDVSEISRHALTLVRAARAGEELPPTPDVDPGRVEDAGAYAGRYLGAERTLQVEAHGDRLLLVVDGERVSLYAHAWEPRAFIAAHPEFERFLVWFTREGDRVTGLSHGPDRYSRARVAAPATDHPPEWEAYAGHYRSHNPWFTNFRVAARDGSLVMIPPGGVEAPFGEPRLVPLGDGLFRVGEDERSPERLRFDVPIDGRVQRANYSGGEFWRSFTP